MEIRERHSGDGAILYDAACLDTPEAYFFDPAHWHAVGSRAEAAGGRGSTWFFSHQGHQYALRHYRRGGLVRHFNRDRYLWTGLERTRAWREFRVLTELKRRGLPVPSPVAAQVTHSALWYRADIITGRIADTRTLAERLGDGTLAPALWHHIGSTVRHFHVAGLEHADLNAHNILLDARDGVFVIDFDRAVLRTPAANWQHGNLARLRRSLDKLCGLRPGFGFDESGWTALLSGYQSM